LNRFTTAAVVDMRASSQGLTDVIGVIADRVEITDKVGLGDASPHGYRFA